MNNIHPDAAVAIEGRGLNVDAHALSKNIGRRVTYINPTCVVERKEEFEIIGIQRLYNGQVGYRLLGDYDIHRFGRAASTDKIQFID